MNLSNFITRLWYLSYPKSEYLKNEKRFRSKWKTALFQQNSKNTSEIIWKTNCVEAKPGSPETSKKESNTSAVQQILDAGNFALLLGSFELDWKSRGEVYKNRKEKQSLKQTHAFFQSSGTSSWLFVRYWTPQQKFQLKYKYFKCFC